MMFQFLNYLILQDRLMGLVTAIKDAEYTILSSLDFNNIIWNSNLLLQTLHYNLFCMIFVCVLQRVSDAHRRDFVMEQEENIFINVGDVVKVIHCIIST